MTIDTAAPRSRRTLLAAGLGGAIATVATALGRPQAAQATDGLALVVGQTNTATTVTTIQQDTGSATGLAVGIASNGGTGTAIVGAASNGIALRGTNTSSGPTIYATNTGAVNAGPVLFAVAGTSGTVPSPTVGAAIHVVQTDALGGRYAILAQGSSPDAAVMVQGSGIGLDAQGAIGARGVSAGTGTGLLGISGLDAPAPAAKTGVLGYANQDTTAVGVLGRSPTGIGVYGKSTSNTGLRGDSTSGTAVRAFSTGGRAINATSGGSAAPGIASQSTGGKSAIQGFCGAGAVPPPASETGVQGRCDTSVDSIGVLGESNTGYAVFGDSTDGFGVFGQGYYGIYGTGSGAGVVGDVDGGTGVQGWTGLAFAPAPVAQVGVWAGAENGRAALQVQGVARFNRSGLASFAAGTSSKKVTVPGGITASAFALATIQANRSGVWVRAVVPATADSSITIYLNTTVASTTNIGWMVIG